jgi:two-component system, NtrC family, nitrogen regulation response regulator NtrX
MATEPTDTILIVDDEEPVRKTFREWLDGAKLGCRILSAPDAETALKLANERTIDLAILDWALGAGDDGLQLLQDLAEFNPDIVAIMVTGFANKATPLDAMRMGVRDYLDKNQDLSRDSFLHAVRRQLERLRPVKRERQLHQGLKAFREAVEKIVPLVQSTAALNDPVPLPEAIGGFLQFLQQVTHAGDAVLLVRHYQAGKDPTERCLAYDSRGQRLEAPLAAFARSIAGSVASMQAPCLLRDLERNGGGTVELQPFERGRRSLLAAPLPVAPHIQAVIELFDKTGSSADAAFSADDQRLLQAAAVFGTDLLRQALAQRQTNQVLLDAVAAALGASETVARSLAVPATNLPEQPPPAAVLDQLREGLRTSGAAAVDPGDSLRLAEAIRVLAVRHGTPAIEHCIRLVESLRTLLDIQAGIEGPRPSPPKGERGRG